MTDNAEARLLRSQVGRGIAWSTADVVVARTGNFALGLVVARLLDPKEFGIFAIALVVHQIVLSMYGLGLASALARADEESSKAAAPTVATITLVSSTLLGVMMVIFAPEFARALGDVDATATMRVLALSLPLAGLTSVPYGMLKREFRTDILFFADLASLIVSAVVVIVLATSGAGPLALAWSWIAGFVATVIVLICRPGAWYWPGWDRKLSWPLLRFGLPLTGANFLNYAIQNVDYVVVGAVAGPIPLGFYVLAFNMTGWPENIISAVVQSVSVPAFARLREMGNDMGKVVSETLGGVAKLTLPTCFFMGALANSLVILVYGSKWEKASTVLVTLCLMGAARTLISVFSDYLVSAGRTTAIFLAQAVWLPSLAGALVFAVHRNGIVGAGIAQAVVSWLVVMPVFMYAAHRSGVPYTSVIRVLAPTFCWAAVCAALAGLVAARFSSPFLACLAGGASGLAVYVLPYIGQIRRAIGGERARRSSGSMTRAQGGPTFDETASTPALGLSVAGASQAE